jgi:hypothetical protein
MNTTTKILNKIMNNPKERDYWIGFSRVNDRDTIVRHLRVVHHNSVLGLDIPPVWEDILIREVLDADYLYITDCIISILTPT